MPHSGGMELKKNVGIKKYYKGIPGRGREGRGAEGRKSAVPQK